MKHTWLVIAAALALLLAGGVYLLRTSANDDFPDGLYAGNGRVEGTEVKIAAKYPGRIVDIAPQEGDDVKKNDIIVRLDDREARAGLSRARAEHLRITHSVHAAGTDVERLTRELNYAQDQYERTSQLFERGTASQQQLDRDDVARVSAIAALEAARAALMEAEAQLAAAQAQIDSADAVVAETVIRAPISGRVLFRIAEPGEIIQAGGNILLLVDLDRPYMTIYVDEVLAGKISIGAEALIWTDAFPDRPFPARVTFISSKAEFTPKEVQTSEERQNLVFRVKLTALNNDERLLKPGMPGVGLIRTDSAVAWPQSAPRR